MKKALNKSEAIQKTIKAYKNDNTLNMRAAARLYDYSDKSIANHLNSVEGKEGVRGKAYSSLVCGGVQL